MYANDLKIPEKSCSITPNTNGRWRRACGVDAVRQGLQIRSDITWRFPTDDFLDGAAHFRVSQSVHNWIESGVAKMKKLEEQNDSNREKSTVGTLNDISDHERKKANEKNTNKDSNGYKKFCLLEKKKKRRIKQIG